MKSRIIVSAVIEKDGRILFGRKREGIGPYPDTWHLIGGGVELEEESLEEGLIREIREETGLEVSIGKKIGFDEDIAPDKHGELTRYVFLVYSATWLSGEPEPNDAIVELKWFPKEKLGAIELNRPSLRLFKKMSF